jgi:signal transduction histidine kinase
MARLVNDLLDVNRISRNTLELRKERVELSRIINAVTDTSRPFIKSSGHELTVRLPRKPVYLEADVVRLAQVFSNLLHNAAKYGGKTPYQTGQILLTAEQTGSTVTVTVKDSGIGIAASMLPRVFDMFTQVGRSLEQTEGGRGSLSLAKRLVECWGAIVRAVKNRQRQRHRRCPGSRGFNSGIRWCDPLMDFLLQSAAFSWQMTTDVTEALGLLRLGHDSLRPTAWRLWNGGKVPT